MSKFLERFIELMDTEFIHFEDWMEIVGKADNETLLYIEEVALVESKYRRDDWLDFENKQTVLKAIDKRLSVKTLDHGLISKWFNDVV